MRPTSTPALNRKDRRPKKWLRIYSALQSVKETDSLSRVPLRQVLAQAIDFNYEYDFCSRTSIAGSDGIGFALHSVFGDGAAAFHTAAEITLFHAIRNPEPDWASESNPSAGEAAAEQEMRVRKALVPVFEKAVASLEAAGISSERISVKVISGMATRGGALYAQALQGDFGTIVVGRRGVSNVKTFPIGRVPMKLVQLINE